MQFLSRPFVVGDRVEISTPSGSKSIVGVVEKIEPMSTHLRTNQWLPIIVPNKVPTMLLQYARFLLLTCIGSEWCKNLHAKELNGKLLMAFDGF